MLKRIPARLTASILAFLALILVTALATGYYLQANRFDALEINLVVRQAARVGALAREVATYSPETHEQASARVAALRQAFEQTTKALNEGGSAPLDDSSQTTRECPAVSYPPAVAELAKVTSQWNELAKSLDEVVASKGEAATARTAFLGADRQLRADLDAAASQLQSHAESKISQLFWIQAATTAAGILLVILILWATRRDIGMPLRRLVVAAEKMSTGDIATPIDTSGLVEIAELAESFERLRLSVKAIMQEAEAAAPGADLDDELDDELDGL